MTNPAEVVLITGASAGVGRAVAREFARHGAKIGLLARGVESLEGAAKEVEALGGEAIVVPTDVSKEEQIEAAAAAVEQRFGPIDIWVNNAMVSTFAPFWDLTAEEYRHITEVTYLGYVYGTMAALRRMMPRDRGTIVQVGSALAHRAIPLQSAYCGAKHAIDGFTESVRTELFHKKSQVHVTIVQLPGVNTTQFEWTRNKMGQMSKPVGKMYQPEVAADAIYFAAHARRKSMWVGWPTVQSMVGDKVAASALDHYLADVAWEGSLRDKPVPEDYRDNFWAPVPGDHGARGPFSDQAADSSMQVWASKHRRWLAGAALAAVGGIVAGVLASVAATKTHSAKRKTEEGGRRPAGVEGGRPAGSGRDVRGVRRYESEGAGYGW